MSSRPPFVPYIDQLLATLEAIEREYVEVLDKSQIRYVNPNRPGNQMIVLGAADWGWVASGPGLEQARMQLLGKLREWRPRFELLFPHPTPEVAKRHKKALEHLERWLIRPSRYDHRIPREIPGAVEAMKASVTVLRAARELLPTDPFPVRAVPDTNVLLDDPNLAAWSDALGKRYLLHLLPVVLRELDDHKRAGRNLELREAAKATDRRLKSLRDNGDVGVGAKVAGDVWAVFEHTEPDSDLLPTWLDLQVPDDRLVAAALLLQSAHPGSALVVVTGDLNMQTKLSAVGLPFLDP